MAQPRTVASTQRRITRTRQAAKRAGLTIETPKPSLPITEQEETDTM